MVFPLICAFAVGSSIVAIWPFFLSVGRIPPDRRSYSYRWYSLAAPLYLGLVAALMWYLGSPWPALLSPLFVLGLALWQRAYPPERLYSWRYVATLLTVHYLVLLGIVWPLLHLACNAGDG